MVLSLTPGPDRKEGRLLQTRTEREFAWLGLACDLLTHRCQEAPSPEG
jgi:hypothetical protein